MAAALHQLAETLRGAGHDATVHDGHVLIGNTRIELIQSGSEPQSLKYRVTDGRFGRAVIVDTVDKLLTHGTRRLQLGEVIHNAFCASDRCAPPHEDDDSDDSVEVRANSSNPEDTDLVPQPIIASCAAHANTVVYRGTLLGTTAGVYIPLVLQVLTSMSCEHIDGDPVALCIVVLLLLSIWSALVCAVGGWWCAWKAKERYTALNTASLIGGPQATLEWFADINAPLMRWDRYEDWLWVPLGISIVCAMIAGTAYGINLVV